MFIDLYSAESSGPQAITNAKLAKFDLRPREKEIIDLVLAGKSNKDIAETLDISINTVKKHLYNIFNKIGVDSGSQLISLLMF